MSDRVTLPGWAGVRRCYTWHNFRKSVLLPAVLALAVTVTCLATSVPFSSVARTLLSLSLTVAPTVMGFTLAGYALIISQSNSQYMQAVMNNDDSVSMFQKLNATFAVVLGMSFSTTLVAVMIKIVMEYSSLYAQLKAPLLICGKALVTFVLAFLLLYTVMAVMDITINIFNYGQFVQAYHDNRSPEDKRPVVNVFIEKKSLTQRLWDKFRGHSDSAN